MKKHLLYSDILIKNSDIIYRLVENGLYILAPDYVVDINSKIKECHKELVFEGNRTAADVWELIDGNRTLQDIIDSLSTKYEETENPNKIYEDVIDFCDKALQYNFIILKD